MDLHLAFQRGQPCRIGGAGVGEQAVAAAHRRFVAGAVGRMAGMQRKRQPVEKPPPPARAFGEQAIHGGGEPQDGETLGQRSRGAGAAADPHGAPVGRAGQGSGADGDIVRLIADLVGFALFVRLFRVQRDRHALIVGLVKMNLPHRVIDD